MPQDPGTKILAPGAAPPPGSAPGIDYGALAYQDPAMRVYMRKLGADEAEARAAAQRRLTSLRQQEQLLSPAYADQLMKTLESTSQAFENNGSWRSSNRLKKQANDQAANEGQMLGERNSLLGQMDDTSIALQDRIASNRRGAAEQVIDSAQATQIQNAQLGLTGAGYNPSAPRKPGRITGGPQ
jgi:hypothetical protein